MRSWSIATIGMALAAMAWGCGMGKSAVFQPEPLDDMKEAQAGAETEKLDAEVTAFLRDKYEIVSASYYELAGEVPWIAISKSVRNQMAAKSIQPVMFDWYEPGLDFVDVYPQGSDGAFALAMPEGSRSAADKLIGFYVLKAPAAAQD